MKIEITKAQATQFNMMRHTLIKISKEYQTPKQLRRDSEGQYGLDFEEAIEMSYENIQNEASFCVKGIRELKPTPPNESK